MSEDMRDLRIELLSLRRKARELKFLYNSKYAQAHLEEVNLMLGLCVVQMHYAELARTERDHKREMPDEIPEGWTD